MPNFLATLMSYSVLVECYSISANFIIDLLRIALTTLMKRDATIPNRLTIAIARVEFSSIY